MTPTEMEDRLKQHFPQAAQVAVTDLTGGGDHYEVFVHCKSLAGLTRIQQHQKIMAAFAAELKTGEVHALAIRTLAQ